MYIDYTRTQSRSRGEHRSRLTQLRLPPVLQYIGLMASTSVYRSWVKANTGGKDPLVTMREELQRILQPTSDDQAFQGDFGVFLILARKA